MKKCILSGFLSLLTFFCFAQSTYLQIKGEAGLSVFVNGVFKCKTSAELKGCIIENITPGSNLIKVSKEGYAPYEEKVTINKGEVFAYSVKPFTKHTVTISQEGNAAETEKKAELKTGKLIVQSVPIEINITIPEIEGVNNMAKTRDQWIVDKIADGSYTLTFNFNGKNITKTVNVEEDNTTTVFINMLSGEFNSSNTLEPKVAWEKTKQKIDEYTAKLWERYKFKPYAGLSDFMNNNPDTRRLQSYPYMDFRSTWRITEKQLKKNPGLAPGFTYMFVEDNSYSKVYNTVTRIDYTFVFTKELGAAKSAFDKQLEEFKKQIPVDEIKITDREASFTAYNTGRSVTLRLSEYEKGYYETLIILVQSYPIKLK